jgi:transposase
MQTTTHPKDWREGRRLRAWELDQQGWKQGKIAEALGVTQGAVSQWLKRARDGGLDALRTRTSPGAPSRLAPDQLAALPARLARGAPAFGFLGDVWTRARVAEVIKREFGVTYHPDHVARLLKAVGWTVQKPTERATQRDEAEIAAWREQQWPEIKKKRRRKPARSSG